LKTGRGSIMIDREGQDFEFEISISLKLAQRGWLTMSWVYGGGDAVW